MPNKIQSVLFNKKYYTLKNSRKWLKHNDLKYDDLDITDNFYRFRQMNPKKNKKYYTFHVTTGIMYIITQS